VLTLLDTLCSEYKMNIEDARATDMAEAMALRTVIALRHGYTWGEASYAERDV
jgi:hypothetical protein